MARQNGSRLYKKHRRWYADFRDFKDVGGSQEALGRDEPPHAGRSNGRTS